jgi:hypothetical protein
MSLPIKQPVLTRKGGELLAVAHTGQYYVARPVNETVKDVIGQDRGGGRGYKF